MHSGRKAFIIISSALNALIIGSVLPLVIYLLVKEHLSGAWLILIISTFAAFGIMATSIYRYKEIRNLVRQSQERMRDPDYRDVLQKLGYLPSNE